MFRLDWDEMVEKCLERKMEAWRTILRMQRNTTTLLNDQFVNLKLVFRQAHSKSKYCVSSKMTIPTNMAHFYPAPMNWLSLSTSVLHLQLKFDLQGLNGKH